MASGAKASFGRAPAERPDYEKKDIRKLASASKLKELSGCFDNSAMATLSDDDLRAMMGKRYGS